MQAWIATIIAALLVTSTVRADDTEAAAQVHLDRGVAAFGAGDFTLALHELQIVVELVPHKPNPYRWLALTEIQQGDCAHARLDVDSFLARVPTDDARIPELVRARDTCQQRGAPQVTTAPPRDPPITTTERPIVKRWWFWTAVVGVAAATSGILIYATRDDDPTRLPPIVCTAAGCQ
jgi:hypothetical protein